MRKHKNNEILIIIYSAKDDCFKAPEVGNCQNYVARWYFDTKESRCRQFYWGGCGGNANNFADEQACLSRCERQLPPPPRQEPPRQEQPRQEEPRQEEPRREEPRQQDPRREEPRQEQPIREPPREQTERPQQQRPLEPFRSEHCFLPTDQGECNEVVGKYYYNSEEGVCDVFAYGGCGGNQNNFRSLRECEDSCGQVQDPCELRPLYGRCDQNITKYYYDSRSSECVPFTYSGCGGNRNNFEDENECRRYCQRDQGHPDTPEIDIVSFRKFIIFTVPYMFCLIILANKSL